MSWGHVQGLGGSWVGTCDSAFQTRLVTHISMRQTVAFFSANRMADTLLTASMPQGGGGAPAWILA